MQQLLNSAFALTPLDGRNRHKVEILSTYFSDFVLVKYRFLIELQYITQLSEYKIIRSFSEKERKIILSLTQSFSSKDYKKINLIEKNTNHDVKAVEEYIHVLLKKTSLKDISPMVHFALTSDDINNIAYALMTKNVLDKVLLPELKKIEHFLREKSNEYKAIPLLSRTHGQAAVPTTFGKELLVYKKRIAEKITELATTEIKAKLNGNVGNFNAHQFIFPKVNWLAFSKNFIRAFKLKEDLVTTQIEPYDSYITLFSLLARTNDILTGLCIDMWLYISRGYFLQKKIVKEVGSSALPHKINPIYFEGAEGGLGIANSLFEFYIHKLSYSRLQRDLSDSIVRRSWGSAFGYSLLSYQSILEALSRLVVNEKLATEELLNHWEILSEPLQNFLRLRGYQDAYEKTKLFFRGKTCTQEEVKKFIADLDISEKDKKHLQNLKPTSYTGLAQTLVQEYGK